MRRYETGPNYASALAAQAQALYMLNNEGSGYGDIPAAIKRSRWRNPCWTGRWRWNPSWPRRMRCRA